MWSIRIWCWIKGKYEQLLWILKIGSKRQILYLCEEWAFLFHDYKFTHFFEFYLSMYPSVMWKRAVDESFSKSRDILTSCLNLACCVGFNWCYDLPLKAKRNSSTQYSIEVACFSIWYLIPVHCANVRGIKTWWARHPIQILLGKGSTGK